MHGRGGLAAPFSRLDLHREPPMSHEKYEDYQDCIAACHACVVACNHCAASCLQEPHVEHMVGCIGLDSDCAQACQLAVAFMSGGSAVFRRQQA